MVCLKWVATSLRVGDDRIYQRLCQVDRTVPVRSLWYSNSKMPYKGKNPGVMDVHGWSSGGKLNALGLPKRRCSTFGSHKVARQGSRFIGTLPGGYCVSGSWISLLTLFGVFRILFGPIR